MPTRLSLILGLSILLASLPGASQRNSGSGPRGGFRGGPSMGHFSRGSNFGFGNSRPRPFGRPYRFRSFRPPASGRFFREPKFHSRTASPRSSSVPRPPEDLRFSQRTDGASESRAPVSHEEPQRAVQREESLQPS